MTIGLVAWLVHQSLQKLLNLQHPSVKFSTSQYTINDLRWVTSHTALEVLWAIIQNKSHLNFKHMCAALLLLLQYIWVKQWFHPRSDSCVICTNTFKSKRWKICVWIYIRGRQSDLLLAQWKQYVLPFSVSPHLHLRVIIHTFFFFSKQVVSPKHDIGFNWVWWGLTVSTDEFNIHLIVIVEQWQRHSHLGAKCLTGLVCREWVYFVQREKLFKTVFVIHV